MKTITFDANTNLNEPVKIVIKQDGKVLYKNICKFKQAETIIPKDRKELALLKLDFIPVVNA